MWDTPGGARAAWDIALQVYVGFRGCFAAKGGKKG